MKIHVFFRGDALVVSVAVGFYESRQPERRGNDTVCDNDFDVSCSFSGVVPANIVRKK